MEAGYRWRIIGLTASILFAVSMLLQYPLATSFPIGGDAVRYIERLQSAGQILQNGQIVLGLKEFTTNTHYPGAQAIFAVSSLLPLSWPDRFLWWVVLGHLATAIAIGLLLYRLASWQSAAIGIAGWSLTTIGLTRHIEDGTLAQLWSLAAVALFLHQAVRGSFLGMAVLAALTTLIHPYSGLVLILTYLASLPGLVRARSYLTAGQQRLLPSALAVGGLLLLVGVYVAWQSREVLVSLSTPVSSFRNLGAIKSPFGPFLVAAPLGLVLLLTSRRSVFVKIIITSFALVSTLLTFNEIFGTGILIHRFQSYFIMAATILAGLALPFLAHRLFSFRLPKTIFFVLLFLSCGLATWHANIPVYEFYEGPSNNARIAPGAVAAIEWLRDNASSDSLVVSTDTDRHSEWIPILSGLSWEGLAANHPLWHASPDRLQELVGTYNYNYVMFFLGREKPVEQFEAGLARYPIVFENAGAVVLKLEQ